MLSGPVITEFEKTMALLLFLVKTNTIVPNQYVPLDFFRN